jgi:RHS repeat-associated protein
VTVSGSNSNPYQFTGRENDGTGLYYYRSRYYSATLQRFIAQDPAGFAGGDSNLYGYVQNGPTYSRDPSGQGLISGFVGAGMGVFFGAVGTYANNPCASGWQALTNGAMGGALGFAAGFVNPGPVGVGLLAFGGDVDAQYVENGSVNWVQAAGAGFGATLGAGLAGRIFTSGEQLDEGLREVYTDSFGGMGALFGQAPRGSGSGTPTCACH